MRNTDTDWDLVRWEQAQDRIIADIENDECEAENDEW
jgi:hypothetical protein